MRAAVALFAAGATAAYMPKGPETLYSTQEVTITSCGPEVTNCPAKTAGHESSIAPLPIETTPAAHSSPIAPVYSFLSQSSLVTPVYSVSIPESSVSEPSSTPAAPVDAVIPSDSFSSPAAPVSATTYSVPAVPSEPVSPVKATPVAPYPIYGTHAPTVAPSGTGLYPAATGSGSEFTGAANSLNAAAGLGALVAVAALFV